MAQRQTVSNDGTRRRPTLPRREVPTLNELLGDPRERPLRQTSRAASKRETRVEERTEHPPPRTFARNLDSDGAGPAPRIGAAPPSAPRYPPAPRALAEPSPRVSETPARVTRALPAPHVPASQPHVFMTRFMKGLLPGIRPTVMSKHESQPFRTPQRTAFGVSTRRKQLP